MGWGGNASSLRIEPTLYHAPYRKHDHIRTAFMYGDGVMRDRGAQGQVLASTVQCREPKTGQQKV